MYNNKKERIAYHSTASGRQKSNPYYPLSYREYCDTVLLQVCELNDMVRDLPYAMIADFWLMNSSFRAMFKRMARAAAFIHYEDTVQCMMPWLSVNMQEYCQRFKADNYSIEKKYSPNTV